MRDYETITGFLKLMEVDIWEARLPGVTASRVSDQYRTAGHFILEKGREFESIPLTDVERKWVNQFGWTEHQMKMCFANAQDFATQSWSHKDMDVKYVEGYVWANGPIPILHAWIALNGKVVDTTLGPTVPDRRYKLEVRRTGRVFGVIPEEWQYLGVEMDVAEVDHIYYHQAHISLIDDYACGWPMLKK